MTKNDNYLQEYSHRRLNILTGEWVQVSPHRTKRPWQGQEESTDPEHRPQYDPECYLCPGNNRVSGIMNEAYESVYAFTNDFGALKFTIPDFEDTEGLLQYQSEKGICRVVCFSPDHSLTIPQMEISAIKEVVDLWILECETLSRIDFVNYIQIFENKGSMMGCSNPHPHGQIWAQQSIPEIPWKKQVNQHYYWESNDSGLLQDYLNEELKIKSRIIFENTHFVVLVPFWAVWPYETMIVPRRKMPQIVDMTEEEKWAFAEAFKIITIRYDNLFNISFPYSAGIHQAPYDDYEHPEWHWHMVFCPPLLRSATVKKFMVGYELLANPQRDITPEQSADTLRNLPSEHYSDAKSPLTTDRS